MQIRDIPVPEVYKSSADFRFFLKWFETLLGKLQYDTENLPDIYDPLKCPSWLLWMLGDTMGFKYDDRLPAAYNRLVLIYFMSMIRHKGSKDGVTLAAEVNLAQFNVLEYGKEKDILYDRLEDTSIPVNSVQVTPHTSEGYIDVVYMSDKVPIDACIEYVRPVGMYLMQNAGVKFDARSKILIDARLTNTNDLGISIGPTHVGHYSRKDYASMQKHGNLAPGYEYTRDDVYYRNSEYEKVPTGNVSSDWIDPGYRTLYSLQLCNNEHIVKSILPKESDNDKIFGLGYHPQDIEITYPDNYVLPDVEEMVATTDESGKVKIVKDGQPTDIEFDQPKGASYPDGRLRRPNYWNLRYDKDHEEAIGDDVYTVESGDPISPKPAVNPIMSTVGDAISMNDENTEYTEVDDDGNITVVKVDE